MAVAADLRWDRAGLAEVHPADLFVTDNRYDAAPEFPNARCAKVRDSVTKRGELPAKEIWIWKCTP